MLKTLANQQTIKIYIIKASKAVKILITTINHLLSGMYLFINPNSHIPAIRNNNEQIVKIILFIIINLNKSYQFFIQRIVLFQSKAYS